MAKIQIHTFEINIYTTVHLTETPFRLHECGRSHKRSGVCGSMDHVRKTCSE
eukprot:m.236513 g.236513  ORF g.236513 m.236513 type:complete len:52 (+) comp40134_c0_seq1:133-288(+)